MKRSVYLDYMATTPVDPRVLEAMLPFLQVDGDFGNPASNSHVFGWRAKKTVEIAREQVANLINADPAEIIWTSGATEANNLALIGAAQFNKARGRHIITCQTEHKAVLDTCKWLEGEGFHVTYLQPKQNGLLDLQTIQEAVTPDTILLSLMHVNNEIGVIQDITRVGEFAREKNIIFHVDAAQSAGKISLDMQKMPVDLMSFSGHKVYGPKGIGALYVCRKPRIRLVPQIHGGGHENGLRSGTLPTHQIAGMGMAFAIAQENRESEYARILQLRNELWEKLSELPEIYLNGDERQRVAGNLNIYFRGVDGEALMMALPELAISSGSACNSILTQSSYVIKALGFSDERAYSSLRISIGRFTTAEEIDFAAKMLKSQVIRLRGLSPLWEKYHESI